jgi:hypothetical protein
MNKVLLLFTVFCMAIAAHAQDVPYSKYLNFSKTEFKDNHFKYDSETNTWALRKRNGLVTTLNILAIIADGYEDIRPSSKDYAIAVQMGADEKASYVKVKFYNDETYNKLLAFVKTNCKNTIDVSSGKIVKHLTTYGEYEIELEMEQHIISRTSARTADPKTVKNVDESYNEYEFMIKTDVKPWSKRLEKEAAKQAKRDAKGKKKQSVNDLM